MATADFIGRLANCPIVGEESASSGEPLHNQIELRLGRRKARLIQDPEFAQCDFTLLQGHPIVTTSVVISSVPAQLVPEAERIANDLSWLLSFATMSKVRYVGYQHGDEEVNHRIRGVFNCHRPTIDVNDGSKVRRFLESCWLPYRRLKRKRKLPVAIEYISEADTPFLTIEMQALMAFAAFECLKATYAKSSGFPFIRGRFRGPTGKKPYSFEDLAAMMLDDVGMKRGLRRIIKLRNEIVHHGLAQGGSLRIYQIYCSVQGLLREYLVRLLAFRGKFIDYETFEVRQINGTT